MLKNALMEEINAWYGYFIVSEHLIGTERANISNLYKEMANDELCDHGAWLLKRINELGGTVSDIASNPALIMTSNHGYLPSSWDVVGDDLLVLTYKSVTTNIENERGAIETYRKIEKFTRDIDPVTNAKVKEILTDEEEHLNELEDFRKDISLISNI